MEDTKKDTNKTKRQKNDHLVRNAVQSYLQRRNYSTANFLENSSADQQVTYSLTESEISRPNSILYSCSNSDPAVIDHNFAKFVAWVRDLVKHDESCRDLEFLVGPLFCHLYLDILKGGYSEKATTFFKAHMPAIDIGKCDEFVQDLINSVALELDADELTDEYRTNKYCLELSQRSLLLLQKFVAEQCHVVVLHILQTWFDLKETNEGEDDTGDDMDSEGDDSKAATANGVRVVDKFREMVDVIQELENEQPQVFQVNISATKDGVNAALINRAGGLVAYNQNSVVHLRPIHTFDSVLGNDCCEIRLSEHEKQVHSIAISPDHTRLITGSADCNVNIYNTGRCPNVQCTKNEITLIRRCQGHLAPVNCVAVSSHSLYGASGSQDHTARLWDLDDGRMLRIFVGHTRPVTCMDFHPNCLYLATGGADHNVRLWGNDSGNPLRLLHGSRGAVYGVRFSPLGDVLASVADDKRVRFWDVLASRMSHDVGHEGDVATRLAWSDDGRRLACGGVDGAVKIWEVSGSSDDANRGGVGTDNNGEPSATFHAKGRVMGMEYSFGTFAVVTSS